MILDKNIFGPRFVKKMSDQNASSFFWHFFQSEDVEAVGGQKNKKNDYMGINVHYSELV